MTHLSMYSGYGQKIIDGYVGRGLDIPLRGGCVALE